MVLPASIPLAGTRADLPADIDARKQAAVFPVHLTSGRVLESVREPVAGYGRLKVVERSGHVSWFPARQVNLQRSTDAWAHVLPWVLLDTGAIQGLVLPGGRAAGPRAQVELPAPSTRRPFLVVLWRPWCRPCVAMAERVLAVRARSGWRSDIDVLTLCLHAWGGADADPGACATADLADEQGTVHAEAWPDEAPGLYRVLGGSSCTTFLVDGGGRVVRSEIQPSILDDVVAAEVRVWGPSREPVAQDPPELLRKGPEPPEVPLLEGPDVGPGLATPVVTDGPVARHQERRALTLGNRGSER